MPALLMSPRQAAAAAVAAPTVASPVYFQFLTVFKGLAAQLIVLHHLAFYGPMSDHVRPLAPLLIGWLDAHARLAVQVFLVIGGFLAARSLAGDGVAPLDGNLRARVARRYLMLAPPFMAAILLTVGASAWARSWMSHESISAAPALAQLAAHALLLQGVLGYEALSAGAWYVAIDFQLYTLFALLVWACSRASRRWPAARAWLLPASVSLVLCSSLFWFNRDARFDVWALYFFGSYGLGTLACWTSAAGAAPPGRQRLLALALLAPAAAALALDFRSRIALALLAAGFIAWAAQRPFMRNRAAPAALLWLGRISYSVFLVHFAVCLVVNAAFTRFAPASAGWQGSGMLVAWAASVLAGAIFHRLVEAPLARLVAPPRAAAWPMSGARALLLNRLRSGPSRRNTGARWTIPEIPQQ
jgi:peptidoglycan/LPS O-acetylase OafA/YrhL